MYLIKNNKLGIIVHTILVQAIIVQAIIGNKLSILSNKLSIIVHTILVQAIIVQRYSCAPNILYYINHSKGERSLVQGQHLRVAEPKTSGSSGGQRNLRYGRAKGT